MQEIQIKQLTRNLLASGDTASGDTITRLQEKLSSLEGVRLERSTDTLTMLWEELSDSKPVTVEGELNASSTVSLYSMRPVSTSLSVRDSEEHYQRSRIVSGRPCSIPFTQELS